MDNCVCGNRDAQFIKHIKVPSGQLKLVYCSACELIRDVYNQENQNLYETLNLDVPTEELYQFNLNYVRQYIDFMQKWSHGEISCKTLRIIEIGCSWGYLLDLMHQEGWDARGIELNPSAMAYCQSRGFDVTNKSLAEAEFPENHFDCLVATHVIEHIANLDEFLQEVYRFLKPGGFLFLAVPDYGSFLNRTYPHYRKYLFLPKQHIWYFTYKTFKNTCVEHGFNPVRIERVTHVSQVVNPIINKVKNLTSKLLQQIGSTNEIVGLFRKPLS